MKHGTSPRTGSSGNGPGAKDRSIRGNGENTIKDGPNWSIRSGMQHGTSPPDWIVRG